VTEPTDRATERPTLDELQDELGAAFAQRADQDAVSPRRWRLRRLGPLLGVVALAGGGAGVAIAANDDSSNKPPEQITPVVTAFVGPDGQLHTFECEAESRWFFAAVGGDLKQFVESGAELPTAPSDICDGEPPFKPVQ